MNFRKLIFFLVLFFTSLSFAETMYVTDRLKITLRSGPDVSYRVIGHIYSGETVSSYETEHKWTKILTSSGKGGWVLSRFITTEEPKKDILARLNNTHEKLTQRAKALSMENKELKRDNKKLSIELANQSKLLNTVKMDFQNLKNDCSTYSKLKKTYQEEKNKLNLQNNELITLKQEKAILETYYFFWGFGLSLGVLILGFIAGKALRRKKSQRLI